LDGILKSGETESEIGVGNIDSFTSMELPSASAQGILMKQSISQMQPD
jgi:hypothetical protein